VTPSEKPGRNGKNAEPDGERTTVLATEDMPGTASEAEQDESNGEVTEVDLAQVTPPPWQRVGTDAGYGSGSAAIDQPTLAAIEDPNSEVTAPYARPETPPPSPPPSPSPPQSPSPPDPASVEPPVVTGTAASRIFGGMATPPSGFAPPRTTVHLEGTSAGAATPPRGAPAASPNVLRRPGRGPRRANLQIKRFDPWSVLKLSLVLGVALFFVWLVAVGALYAVLDGMGVWDKVNGISTDLLQGNEGTSAPLISAGRVFGIAAIVGAINIVLFSALATVGAFVYNVSADLAGGLEVTLAERE
jgi:hypothetical protein